MLYVGGVNPTAATLIGWSPAASTRAGSRLAGMSVATLRLSTLTSSGKAVSTSAGWVCLASEPITQRCRFMGLKALYNGVVRFNNVKVPRENILFAEGKGLRVALSTLNTGRLTLPAACVGLGKRCLEISRRWAAERVQWGAAIGKHDAIANKLGKMAAEVFAMEAVTCRWCGRDDAIAEAARQTIGLPADVVREVLAAERTMAPAVDPTALLARYIEAAEHVWRYVDRWRPE